MSVMDANHSQLPRKPIAGTLAHVMAQVDYDCFADLHTRRIDPFFMELCLIISEILAMDPEGMVRVAGSEMPVCLVQEIYGLLRHDHLRLVYDNFNQVSSRVFNKKAYLRTALYNAVFELESHYVNEFCRC